MPGMVRQFAGFAGRTAARIDNRLGVIPSQKAGIKKSFRRPDLDIFDAYYESRQYLGLPPWDEASDQANDYVKVRKRQPRMIFNFTKVLTSRVTSKLVGSRAFPEWLIEDDPDSTEFFRFVRNTSMFRAKVVEPIRRMLTAGSGV